MYGTQTRDGVFSNYWMFENDVEMYGTQTPYSYCVPSTLFENDVEMYGTQTYPCNNQYER